MSVNSLAVNYDRDHDVLYISIGEPVPSYVDDDFDGVLIRRSYQDDVYSGVTILDFSSRDTEKLKLMIPFMLDFEYIKAKLH